MRTAILAASLFFLALTATASDQTSSIDPATIPAADYVVADADGHLTMRGERIRFWGAIGGLPTCRR